jgi:uncharacterized protein
VERDAPHLPQPAVIDAYGDGGFRFAGMSHRGSLLCLPAGMWASPVTSAADVTPEALSLLFSAEPPVELFLIGAGRDPWALPAVLRTRFQEAAIAVEAMSTGSAVSTYNILLGEGRRVGALLIAV